MDTRRATAVVLYNNTDITADLNKYLKSISYTDNLSGEADDLQITLEDRAGLWESAWMPDKGATLDVSIVLHEWDGLENYVQRLGLFEIDEITSSGYPSEVQIKAVSVPDNTTLRGTERTRSWEKAELKRIASDIAGDAGLELVYDVEEYNPVIDRAEQSEQSDLSFLYKLCADHGLALKISDKQLIIFDVADYEQKTAILAVVKPTGDTNPAMLTGYSLSTKIRDVYKTAHVKYQDGTSNTVIEATFTDPHKQQGKTLEINEQVTDIADAERLAKKRLREQNSEEITGTFDMVGNPLMLASVTLNIAGFGAFDGQYIITRAQHDLGAGYNTSIDVRRCLDGY